MKAYLAGKITGDPNYQEKFRQAQEDLERQGVTVLSPACLPEGMRAADYMRICLAMIDSADVVAFLPDYKESRGAQLEWSWCRYVGKATMYLESIGGKPRCMCDTTVKEMVELKTCPFCGGEADCSNTGICDKDGNALWWVECAECKISTDGYRAPAEAIAAWNCRTTLTPPKEATYPCDLCVYNPPSSLDGKPCTYCPATGRPPEGEAK